MLQAELMDLPDGGAHRRPAFGLLQIELTVNDPKAYTHPWTVTMKHLIALNTELIDFFCNENEQDAKHLQTK